MALQDRTGEIGRCRLISGYRNHDPGVRGRAFALVQVGGARDVVPLPGYEADVLLGDAASHELAHRGLRGAEVVEEPDNGFGHSASLDGRRTCQARPVPGLKLWVKRRRPAYRG